MKSPPPPANEAKADGRPSRDHGGGAGTRLLFGQFFLEVGIPAASRSPAGLV